MKRLLIYFLLGITTVLADNIFTVPVHFSSGSSIDITNGVPITGVWNFSGATVTGLTGTTLNFSGNVTGSGISTSPIGMTISTIPDLVAQPGSILSTNIAAPVAPTSGHTKLFVDSTGKRFHDRNDTGSTGTTVVGTTPVPYKVITVINPSTGAVTISYPIFPDSDPLVYGAGYWSGGVLTKSSASPTPTATATATATASATSTATATATATATSTNTPTPTPTP